MKKTTIIGLSTLVLFSAANAYTVAFTNIGAADPTAVPILDNTGTPIAFGGGYVSAGTFSAVPSTVEDIKTFTAFGAGGTAFANDFSAPGFFNAARTAPIPEGTTTAPVGEDVYVVIGNGSTLADSDQFAVFNPGLVFGTENSVGAGGVDAFLNSDTLTQDSLVFGTLVTDIDTGLGVTFTEGIELSDGTFVPEPSTSLLAALAGLALAARRRR
jgi:hypothetical protein